MHVRDQSCRLSPLRVWRRDDVGQLSCGAVIGRRAQDAHHLIALIGGVVANGSGQQARIKDGVAFCEDINFVPAANLGHIDTGQISLAQGSLAAFETCNFGADKGEFIGRGAVIKHSVSPSVLHKDCMLKFEKSLTETKA